MVNNNRVQAAMDALVSGKDVDAAVSEVGDAAQVEDTVEETIDSPEQEMSGVEDVSEEKSSEPSPSVTDEEEVVVNGRKVKINYTDRDRIKKYVQMAGGARKWQAERDSAKRELQEYRESVKDSLDLASTLEQAFNQEGIAGVIKSLAGDERAFESWKQSEFDRLRKKETASPSELERIELEEKYEREKKSRERLENETKAERAKREADEETRELDKLQSIMTPAFNKWRFAGKIGDAAVERDIDEMIWAKTKESLKQLPPEVQLTSQVVEREFRKSATNFNKLIDKKAKSVVSKDLSTKKEYAASKAAIQAGKGPANNTKDEDVRNKLRTGNLRDAFMTFIQK